MKLADLLRYYAGKTSTSNSGKLEMPATGHIHTECQSTCKIEVDLPGTIDDWPVEWRASYEERAAIMEFDGGLNRSAAEQQSEQLQRKAFRCKISVNATSEIIPLKNNKSSVSPVVD